MSTLKYYSQHAQEFVSGTVQVDFKTTQERFLRYLKPKASILDFGCGSGRDSRYFAERGFAVTAVDGCAELVEIASSYTGLNVKQMLFQELSEVCAYDGIWACASILHLPKAELVAVLKKLEAALKPEGYLYVSFKYGDFEGLRNGRYFTDMTEKSFEALLAEVSGLKLVDEWVSGDVREGRSEEKWLNVILRKE